ncbi:hypothetical protein USDA257_c27260 [Sinorhizobium fredii USDA 257]|uniref:Uncharacterized protein n=1 Tax=Sinorhizobium fredii (strain USDA 257) TaxID=1185652 RepID=I3X5Z3_SINF2|nr:hypothetical protein USDA257_c27260 [Sinorhizobium fredii USDA 257]
MEQVIVAVEESGARPDTISLEFTEGVTIQYRRFWHRIFNR